ncbi:branched-chain amino acid ABC transporter permease [Azospirillum sp.]|uniref:branched-chain amino acid ABC transporter permease n=1 Tax=Azospirillum sp. TaxID=34012 RepID=UPI002D3A6E57|nr:branched-chain amino acid ABC transporter permease [Azospirillum sp.]HYD64457.1 branched-chain amino acid ABC transporter permease [Azospirillum sp.]
MSEIAGLPHVDRRAPGDVLRLAAGPAGSVALAAVLLALPLLVAPSWLFTLGIAFANSLGVLSVSVLVRYGGEVSIGHSVFAAAGAYTVAILEKHYGVSLWISLPLAVTVGVLLGIAFAWPSRRLSGIYLAVTTMALALALPEVIDAGDAWTGGYEGLYVAQAVVPLAPVGLQRYYVALLLLFAGVYALARLRESRQGMALLLARSHPAAADAFGTRRAWARIAAMAISTGLAAAAGASMAYASATVSPSGFTLWSAVFLLVGSVVSFYGLTLGRALVGGAFLTLVPQVLAGSGAWIPVFYGCALLAVILVGHFAPKIRGWIESRRGEGRSVP